MTDRHRTITQAECVIEHTEAICPDCETILTCPCCAQVRRGRSGWTDSRRETVRRNGRRGGRPRTWFIRDNTDIAHETDPMRWPILIGKGYAAVTKAEADRVARGWR